jgi:hypothetical protein
MQFNNIPSLRIVIAFCLGILFAVILGCILVCQLMKSVITLIVLLYPKKRSDKLTPCMEESTQKVNVNFDVLMSTTIQIFCIRQILEKKWKQWASQIHNFYNDNGIFYFYLIFLNLY